MVSLREVEAWIALRGRGQVGNGGARTEPLPVHRADVVAAIEPLTPSVLDFLAKPVHCVRVSRDSVVRVVSTQLLVKLVLLFRDR